MARGCRDWSRIVRISIQCDHQCFFCIFPLQRFPRRSDFQSLQSACMSVWVNASETRQFEVGIFRKSILLVPIRCDVDFRIRLVRLISLFCRHVVSAGWKWLSVWWDGDILLFWADVVCFCQIIRIPPFAVLVLLFGLHSWRSVAEQAYSMLSISAAGCSRTLCHGDTMPVCFYTVYTVYTFATFLRK